MYLNIEPFPGTKVGLNTYTFGQAEVTISHYAQDDIRSGSSAGINIRSIKVPRDSRRQGHATAAMHEIVAWANATDTVLYLQPEPFDDRPIHERTLRSFYARFGFRRFEGRIMCRRPAGIARLL